MWIEGILGACLLLQVHVSRGNIQISAPSACHQLRTAYQQQSQESRNKNNIYLPKCTEDGLFEPVQCNDFIGSCWCVDQQGYELAGTRQPSLDLVNCTAPRGCASYQCRMLCPYGFELDEDGCPLCQCRNPCDHVTCPAGQECTLEEVPCRQPPCTSLPTCKQARSFDNLCPIGKPLSSPDNGRPFLCGIEPNKPQCPVNYLCDVQSGNDYGVCCPLVDKPGLCPATNLPVEADDCSSKCNLDMDCKDVEKCCTVEGCGNICIAPANVTLCLQQKAVVELLLGYNPDYQGYIPQCSETGEFVPKQCSINGLLCWCVDVNGTHIRGTMGPPAVVHCDQVETESRSSICNKTCDRKCESGYKYNEDGCITCQCVDPCEKIDCPEGSICLLMKEEPCLSNKCSLIPTCHRKPTYNCTEGNPLINNSTGKVFNCHNIKCPSTHECEKTYDNNMDICCPKLADIDVATSETCPEFIEDANFCNNNTCATDIDCHDDMKCCPSKSCGGVCVSFKPPRLPTMCEYLRDMGIKHEHEGVGPGLLAIPIPDCREDGTYEPIQCDRHGECWCVDDFGVEISNTRAVSRSNVDCHQARSQRPCLGLVCRLGCDYGYVLDDKECPICECRNPCKSAKCPGNQICQFFEVKCDSNWCPPLPQCVTYDKAQPSFPECPHGSPMVYEDNNLLVTCDPNSNYQLCPHDHLCTVSRPNEPGVCCPKVADRTNYLNGSDEIISSDTKTTPVELIKLGTCPEIKSWEVGTCAEECHTDKDCPGPQKCCKNSCGASTCRDPTGMTGKPGQCPYLVPVTSGSCDYECSSDYDCVNAQKCCSNGCGTQCVHPMTLTACQHQKIVAEHRSRELGIPASRMYLPSCTKTGNFEPVQCHPVSRVCWCVDENGIEIPGSRTLAGEVANCSSVGICDPIECNFQCPNGFQLDENGCPICSCRNPCQGVVCKVPGETCRSAKVKCSNSPCPPLPLCLPNLKNPCPIGEPLHNNNTGNIFQCGPLGGQCPSSHKCHLSPLGEYAVCCPKPKDVCYQKLDPGHCKASLPRWYFDNKEFVCKKFYYGGCGGSLNNFASREHCEQTCSDMSSCGRVRDANLKLLKASHNHKIVFLPKCNKKTGDWEPLQCMESIGLCWCVNEQGNQISGTAVRGIPYCTSRSGREFSDSSLCSNGLPAFLCPENMCENKICLANRNATCRVNPCGGCKAEFYNEMNEIIDCEEGLSACFTEMQEVLNSHAWKNHNIPQDRVDQFLPAAEDPQYLPPPAYPPPPPPPMTMIGRSIEGFIIENPNHIPEEETYPEQEDEDLQMSSSHVTIVVSPRRDGLTIRMSSQMGPKMISNLLQDHMNLFHSFGLPVVKPGFCPSPSLLSVLRSMSQICRDRCFYDSDCPNNKKCCLSKCGMGCVDPYLARQDVEPKAGTCPEEDRSQHRLTLACLFAQNECLQDEDCSGKLKCCSTDCGNHCVEPVVPPIKPSRMAVTLPVCSNEGGYSITQHQEDLSWCVDKYGKAIHDTLTRGDVKCTTEGVIMKQRSVGSVCPDPNQTPKVCKSECLKATCTQHPDAICIADPCNECSILFVNKKGIKLNCQAKCTQPLITGICEASLVRYFFNQSSQLCEQFTYGGCQGNDNNFESLEQCQLECERAVPVCEQPRELGMCRAQITRWYYNKETYQCEEFDYGGCGGNDNNFETKTECEAKCPDLVLCPDIKVTGHTLEPCSRLKACANEVCLGNVDAVCIVDPCTCSASFVDRNGKPVSCDVVTTPSPPELVTPAIPHYSRCEHFLQRALLHWTEKTYTPQCTEDGNFVPMQCTPKGDLTQECWCVDESGSQLPESSTFLAGSGQCDFVKVKEIKVSLAFIHNQTISSEKLEPLIKSLVTRLLDDLSAMVHRDIVDVYLSPHSVKVLFTLIGENKVHVAFQLEEMIRQGMKITQHPDIEIPADFGQSNFYYMIDPIYATRKQRVVDNGVSSQRVSYKKSETETETLVIIAIVSTVIFLIVLAVLVAIALSRRDKDEKPKPSLVSQAFSSMIYGLIGVKSEDKEIQEKKEAQLAIQTIEAQYESIKQKEKEAESCPSETSSTLYADIDETKKEKSIDV